jgi:hypothetical protein
VPSPEPLDYERPPLPSEPNPNPIAGALFCCAAGMFAIAGAVLATSRDSSVPLVFVALLAFILCLFLLIAGYGHIRP